MKRLVLPLLLLTAYQSRSQDLAYKIPKDALAVASVKGDKMLELLSVEEFNRSVIGKKILEELSEHNRKGNYNSIAELGIRLQGTLYYFNQQTDSISYNCLLLPLADAGKFEQIFKERERNKIRRNGADRLLYDEGDNAFLQWNNEMAYLVIGSLKDRFLEEDSVASKRYGIKKVSYSDYYYSQTEAAPVIADDAYADTVAAAADDPVAIDVPVAVEAPAEAAETVDSAVALPAEGSPDPDAWIQTTEAVPALEDIPADAPPPPMVVDAPAVAAEAAAVAVESYQDSYYDNSAYQKAYEEQKAIKKKLSKAWIERFAVAGFHKTPGSGSILENPSWLRSQDTKAAATFYLSDFQSLYHGLIPYFSYRTFGGIMPGYGSINARLYLDKEQARIATEMELDDEKAASFKRMYRHKPNKKFAQYINSDKMVGFLSYSFDTEEYLKEIPQLLETSYGSYLGLYQDEIGMGTELFSLLLDEKAVAKVIKGDAVLLLNDIGPKEYTYTSYEYNDDYERKEVQKTRTETLPDFLLMVSSDDTHLLERLLQYGIRKGKISLKNGIYTLDRKLTGKSPFNVHMLIKDGIVFCGTSSGDLQQIAAGTYQGNISKEQKNLLLKHNMSLFFNPKNIAGKLSPEEFGNIRKLNDFNMLMGNTGTMYARTTGVKNNRISGEMIAEVPANKENALKYFFSMIEQAAKLD